MATKTVTICTCDICGTEESGPDKSISSYTVPVMWGNNPVTGDPSKQNFTFEKLDLCPKCAFNLPNVAAEGIIGKATYKFMKDSNKNYRYKVNKEDIRYLSERDGKELLALLDRLEVSKMCNCPR